MKKQFYFLILLGTVLGCSKSSDTTPITPKPTADFTWTESSNGNVQFTNNSKNATSYQWDFGDNIGKSTSQSPKYTFEFKGNYKVTLTAKGDGGDAQAINTVNITTGKDPVPIANFIAKDLGKGLFQFTNNSQYADTYIWDFGDGSSTSKDKDVQHQFGSNSKFTVTLTTLGKGGISKKSIEVEAQNVPDARDKFVGSWKGVYKTEIDGKYYDEGTDKGMSFKKSNFSDILIFSSSSPWSEDNQQAIVKDNAISYDFISTWRVVGNGTLSADGKTLTIIDKFDIHGDGHIYTMTYVLQKVL